MSSCALLVMDVQEAIVQRFGDPRGYLERLDLERLELSSGAGMCPLSCADSAHNQV